MHSINSKVINSEIPSHLFNENIVGITTRQNRSKETFNVPTIRRPRAPNKTKRSQMEQRSSSKNFTHSSTQTEYTSNKGKGLDTLDPTKHAELFTVYQDTPTHLYRETLSKVFKLELGKT